jgi:hypothetical protein
MPISTLKIMVRGLLWVSILAAAACSPKRVPQMTVDDLLEDRIKLDGVLLKCNENPASARSDSDCLNARIAVERLASQNESAEETKRNAEFERSRERLRLAQEKQRLEQEARTKVDPYNLPLMPVDPAPPRSDAQAPAGGQPPAAQPRP